MTATTARQNVEVLKWLRRTSITPKDALQFGCFRLAARIYELRKAGFNIVTMHEGDGDRVYARYILLQHRPNHPPTQTPSDDPL